MTKSCSPPSGAMPPRSIRDLNPPIISFVGRLDASQKGYDIFLDALDLLERTSLPSFSAWLVGGSLHEVEMLRNEIDKRPGASRLHASSRLILWGRIDQECLPEIYSRSILVVMPSRRETFGIVAVQSMLCGTPVAASYVGGLKNTVQPMWTGAHFKSEDIHGLAFIIQSLIRNRPLGRWLSITAQRWAADCFGDTGRSSGLKRILRVQAGEKLDTHPIQNPTAVLCGNERDAVTRWLGEESNPTLISYRKNTAFRVKANDDTQKYFVKCFTERPSHFFSVYVGSAGLASADRQTSLNRTLASCIAPQVLRPLKQSGYMMAFNWAESADVSWDEVLG